MAQLQDNTTHPSSGIKLFGATISPEDKRSQSQSNDHHRSDDDPTAEKRPEKIIACPRCKSMETKFCYFNNYNVNQPRHFCKGCQRYWTAGGALRNVPVGAGRRKAKPPGMSLQQLDFQAVVGEWRDGGGFGQLFPGKRRRCDPPNSQSCLSSS